MAASDQVLAVIKPWGEELDKESIIRVVDLLLEIGLGKLNNIMGGGG